MSFGKVCQEMKLNSTEPKTSITHVLEGKMIGSVYHLGMGVGGDGKWRTKRPVNGSHIWFSGDVLVSYGKK